METSTLDLFKGIITHTGLWGAIISTLVVTMLGFLLYKFKVVNDISIQSIQKVIITTLLPFLAFYSFLQNAGKEDVKTFGVVFGLSAIYYFLLTTIALIWVKYTPNMIPKKVLDNAEKEILNTQIKQQTILFDKQNYIESIQKKHLVNWLMCIYGSNILFATPIIMALYPTGPHLGSLNVWNILYYIGGFGFSFSLLSGVKFTKKEFGFTIKKAVLNPSFIAVIVALTLWATQYIPGAGSKIYDLSSPEIKEVEIVNDSNGVIKDYYVMNKKATFGPNFSTLFGKTKNNITEWFRYDNIKKLYVPYNKKPTGWFDLSVTMPYLYKPISILAMLVSPLIWIVIGTSLAKSNIKEVFSKWNNWVFLIYKMILIPLFILLLVIPFVYIKTLDYKIAALLVMTGSVPPGTTIVIYSQHFKVHDKYTAQVSSLSTIMSFIFIPMWLSIGTVILSLVK